MLQTKRTSDPQLSVDRVVNQLYRTVDNSSVTFFRVAWGAIIVVWAWDYLTIGRVTRLYIEPAYHFTYLGFDWVRPWPGIGMYLHFWALLFLGLAIAAGFFYRVASVLFAVGMTYVFLLDQANYQNHYYLIVLFAWFSVLLPLNRNFSWDAHRNPAIASQTVPAWVLWCIRLHIGIPYFFGGLAKLIPDWLLGEPMRTTMLSMADWPIFGTFFTMPWAGLAMSWLGLSFDLAIVPLLLYRKTRMFAYLGCLVFHLSNAVIFDIHIFPWFMIVATTIFFEPNWPRRLLGGEKLQASTNDFVSSSSPSLSRKCLVGLAFVYLLFHITFPLRHHFYAGDASWTEQGHFFSWRMMLRGKSGGVRIFVTDPVAKQTIIPDLREYINEEQAGKFARNPEMVLQFAHHLAKIYEKRVQHPVEVRALVLLSLNGRKPQLLIDPNQDLAKVKRGALERPWVLPQSEPLREEPWSLPLMEWEKYVEVPPLEFLAQNPIVRQSAALSREGR